MFLSLFRCRFLSNFAFLASVLITVENDTSQLRMKNDANLSLTVHFNWSLFLLFSKIEEWLKYYPARPTALLPLEILGSESRFSVCSVGGNY